MIRIETTAEFDADGKFVLTGQTGEPVPPGEHRVVVLIGEAETADKPVEPPKTDADSSSCLCVERGLLLLSAPLLPGKQPSVLEILDQIRREREEELIRGES